MLKDNERKFPDENVAQAGINYPGETASSSSTSPTPKLPDVRTKPSSNEYRKYLLKRCFVKESLANTNKAMK